MPKSPPPPPAPPAPLAVLACSGWSVTAPTEARWAGPFHYTAHMHIHGLRLAAVTHPGCCEIPTKTDYTLTGPTDRPRLLELWWMQLTQPPKTAVIAAAYAATAAPFCAPRPHDLARLLTAAGWRDDLPMPGCTSSTYNRETYTAPGGRFQATFLPAEHSDPQALWRLIEHVPDGRALDSLASWDTPAPILAAYLLTAAQGR